MTGGAWALVGLAAVLAAADWTAVARGAKRVEYVCKPGTLIALLGAALLLDPAVEAQRSWWVVALALSLAGDVFLMLPRDLFVPGLVSFLLAHLAYIAGFVQAGTGSTTAGEAAAAVLVAGLALAVGGRVVAAIRRAGPRPLLGPVVVYMVVITVMAAAALLTEPLAGVGAVLFVASDALIAWNRFVTPLSWAPTTIIVTYHVAQALLLLSLS